MTTIGFDLGNLQSVIAVVRHRGIDVVSNEVSNRATPTMVSFGSHKRFLGEAAKTQHISNWKNTVCSLKRMIGQTAESEALGVTARVVHVDGQQLGVKVNYLGEPVILSNVQLLAMYLGQLKTTTEKAIEQPVSDCVLTVPGWFTEIQRRAIFAAASIAGLNCLCLIHDVTAAAMGYAMTRQDLLSEEEERTVAFVDIGHSDMSVSIVAMVRSEMTVIGTAFAPDVSGAAIDTVLTNHLLERFQKKYKANVASNPKAMLKLRVAAEKCKKVLSANAQAPVNIESLLEDLDATTLVDRAEFEEWIHPLLKRLEATLVQAIRSAEVELEAIDAVEIIGGTTRIPIIKELISRVFGQDISTMLNQDEANARGAALAAALYSPVLQARKFEVHDITTYAIQLCCEQEIVTLFEPMEPFPATKTLTLPFQPAAAFTFQVRYAHPDQLPVGVNPWLGDYKVTLKKPGEVEIRVHLDHSQCLSITTNHGKLQQRNTSVPTVLMDHYLEKETLMAANDRQVIATEEAKNALEEYAYRLRENLSEAQDLSSAAKKSSLDSVNKVLDWIYNETEDATKSVYDKKLHKLEKLNEKWKKGRL